jgi:3-deoxy-manno-octulosonate cytidylyltransferase (CMP-KDO synthetase)
VSFKVLIPARYSSTRLPGKPLAVIAGKPMVQHVYERSVASGAERVIIATDDERVRRAATAFGAEVQMTSVDHRSGTERLAEVVQIRGEPAASVIVNVQADEPMLPPLLIRQVVHNLVSFPEADIATLCERITDPAALLDAAVVKVVTNKQGLALYFSRAPIPWCREQFANQPLSLSSETPHYRHVGIYAYRAGYLKIFSQLAACAIERVEMLEQLRVLYHGGRIHVDETREWPGLGVDTPHDLNRVRGLLT